MQAEEFYDRLRESDAFESTDAREVTDATLETLGERIGDSQADELAATLPDGLADPLREAAPDEAEPFSLDEFLDRVADRADIEGTDPLVSVRAVFDALADAADEGELADAREQLPDDFDLAFDAGAFLSADEFLVAVGGRAGLDSTDEAERATTATLETLGERLSSGEAADLATYLPSEFEAAVTEPSDERPPEFDVEEFVARVADRESVDEAAAESRARAVFGALSEAVGDREFRKVRSQLPDEYDALVATDE